MSTLLKLKIYSITFILFLFFFINIPLYGHELRPAYLEIKQKDAQIFQMMWKVPAKSPTQKLSLAVILPEECILSKDSIAHFADYSLLEYSSFYCLSGLFEKTILINGLSSTLTDVLVRVSFLDGNVQTYRLTPASPSFTILRSPSSWSVIRTYSLLGMEHIWSGVDHLLFVLALIILVKGTTQLFLTITAFTVAHSLTLAASVFGVISLPLVPVEACIALSIVFVAREILYSQEGRETYCEKNPWMIAFLFGLLHGFGFAGALLETGLPQSDIPLALLFFNLGVEIGQLVFIACFWLVLKVVYTLFQSRREQIEQGFAYAIGSVSAFWVIERITL